MENSRLNELAPYDNPPVEDRVRALMCGDEEGQVQVIAPESALIDPAPLRASTARDLRNIPTAEDERICAVPGFYKVPSVVHQSLMHKSTVALATEIPGQYVRATGAELKQMCANHASFEAEFCEALAATPTDTAGDIEDINRAVETFTTRRIEARLDETLAIPPLPETAQRIVALQGEENFDLDDMVTIVEADPAISARIMGWANSSFYGTSTPSKTLNDAIMRVLGFDLVFNMALGMSIGASLNLPKSHVSGASPYWLDAVYSAATTEALARQVPQAKRPNPGTCYLAGLLSNFGTLVIGHVFPPQYEAICRMQEANPQVGYPAIDQHVLLVNREVIAATLLEQWGLPDEITTAVRFQNVGDYNGAHAPYVHLLRVAQDLLCHGVTGLHDDSLLTLENLELSDAAIVDVAEVIRESQEELGELAHALER